MNLQAYCPHGILMTRVPAEEQKDINAEEMYFVSEYPEGHKGCGCYFRLKVFPGVRDTIFMGQRRIPDDRLEISQ
jgi:hypothetical protein